MEERMVIGVDFSGAGHDTAIGNTWVTTGLICTEETFDSKKGDLLFQSCKSVSRESLTGLLKDLPRDAVAALDFPFSVPIAFSGSLGHPDSEMPWLWQAAAAMGQERFIALRDEFVKGNGEPLRAGDLHVPGCYSCLHNTNPNMVPMTFHGMKMLDALWEQTDCRIPPLEFPERIGPVLLEVMPGAALKALELPDKGYKSGQKAFENRQKILRELPKKASVNVINLRDFSDEAMFADHALDSMVAAVVAAAWSMDESENAFAIPRKAHTVGSAFANYKGTRRISPGIEHLTEVEAARKEGWIYVPKKQLSRQIP